VLRKKTRRPSSSEPSNRLRRPLLPSRPYRGPRTLLQTQKSSNVLVTTPLTWTYPDAPVTTLPTWTFPDAPVTTLPT
jgi:hypothetical protein